MVGVGVFEQFVIVMDIDHRDKAVFESLVDRPLYTSEKNRTDLIGGAVSIRAAVDQRTGMRTELKPLLFMRGKYAESRVTPHSPSLGASSMLPRLIPRPSIL